ncbi:MAG: hypothetical protein HYX27_05400 [Acidobacteria bacterium]|nr:hypothetical protein [Acidobacteriota bacterium]
MPAWVALLIALAVYYLFRLPALPGYTQAQWKKIAAERERQIAKRVAELGLDPANALFLPLVLSGRLLADAEIAAKRRRVAELEDG